MNLDNAQARALKTTAPKAAAKLYADIEYELALGEPSDDQERAGEAALAVLEERFPDVKASADQVMQDGHTPAMSRTAASHAYEPTAAARTVNGADPAVKPATPDPSGPRKIRPAARRRVQQSRTRRSLPRSVGQKASQGLTIVDQATGSWSGDVWMFVMGGIGLSIALLLLRNPEGVSKLFLGTSNAIKWITDPTIDPLNPKGRAT